MRFFLNFLLLSCPIKVSYLGTDAPLITGGLVDQKEIDYERMEKEFSGYLEKIQAIESGKGGKKQDVSEKMSCHITVSLFSLALYSIFWGYSRF